MNSQGDHVVPVRFWRSILALVALVLLVGLGLAAALALGWRSPAPHRAPDWTGADLIWRQYGDGWTAATEIRYRVQLTQPERRAWAIATEAIADFELQLDVRALLPSEDAGHGVLYRYQDAANYYLFAIGGDGYYTITLVRRGEPIPLRIWQPWPHVRRGAATNRLRVRCQGALCRFHVNDEFTAEILDDTFLSGNVGLWAQTFSDVALTVAFEELRLWRLD
jgi:hypothetical protein